MRILYKQLIVYSKENNYRVLWALRQKIYINYSNDELEKDYLLLCICNENLQFFQKRYDLTRIGESIPLLL